MFLEFDALYNECRASALSVGKIKYYDNAVKSMSTADVDGKFAIIGHVAGESVMHRCSIVFDESGGLYEYDCDCDHSQSNGPCRHIVALALTYEDKYPQRERVDDGPKTDNTALMLMGEYGKKKRKRLMSDEAVKVELVPYVSFADGVSLRFSIGRSKHYRVKDIGEFVRNMAGMEYKRYGVDLGLLHLPSSFTPESARLAQFVCELYKEKQSFGAPAVVYKDELRLMTGDVDDFFDMYAGRFVAISKDEMLQVSDEPLPIKVTVKEVDGGFEISADINNLQFVSGKKRDYVVYGNKIYRITHAVCDDVKDFFAALSVKNPLFVSNADMVQFYNGVLTLLGKFLEVESSCDLTVYEAEPLVCRVFIDSDEGDVVVKIESSYGEVKFDLFNESFTADIVRDWETENAIRGVFAKYFTSYPRLRLSDEGEIFDFISTGTKELFAYAEVFIMDGMKKMSVKKPPKIRVGVRLSEDLLSLEVNADEYTAQEIAAILDAYRENKRYVRLGGGFVDLRDDSISVISEILDNATKQGDEFVMPAYYAPYVNYELRHGFFDLERDSSFKSLVKSLDGIENADIKCPHGLENVLRNYQKTGFRWLKLLKQNGFGGILADDMGLGKSLQVIALMSDEKSRSIIVCPTTLILNWQNEIAKFAPHLKVLAVMGSFEERKAMIERASEYDVVVTSYDLIRRDVEMYCDNFDYAIADEAQFIKNPETKNAIAVKKLKAKHRFALTGTPIENHLGELWSIFDFIMPGYLGNYATFRNKYELGVVKHDEYITEKLKRLVKPFILRRIKSDVLKELPPKIESVMYASFDEEQRGLYDANMAQIRNAVNKTEGFNHVVVLSMLTKLRQICCDPSLVYPDYTGESAKLESCMELVQSAVEGGHKILLFSQYTGMLDIIKRRFMESGISFYSLRGDTPKADRIRMVNKFNMDDTQVFLISLKAGGTGLNLTGADVVIHYDPWWNESVMNQATDRAYRMGQDKTVQVYKLIAKGTLEEKIMELQTKKSELSTAVVGEENGLKEILAILKDSAL